MKKLWPAALVFLTACGGGGNATLTSSGLSASPFSVAVHPSATIASDSDPAALAMQWEVVIANGAAPGRVNFVNATVRDAASGATVWPSPYVNFGPAEIQALGPASLSAGETLRVPQSLKGRLLSGDRSAIVRVAVQFVTDANEILTQTAEAQLPVE